MPLPVFVTDLKTVPEAMREHYEETDGGFTLALDESEFKSKLDEFRRNNRALLAEKKKLEDAVAKFEGVDPEKHKEAMVALQRVQELEDKKLVEEGKVDELVARRVEAIREDHTKQVKAKDTALAAIETERDNLRDRLGSLLIDSAVQGSVSKIGAVRAGAMDDVLNRARQTWVIDEEGNLVAREKDGGPAYSGKGDPLTMDEWAGSLLTQAPYLFEGGGGGGGGGGDKKAGEGNTNKKSIPRGDGNAFGQNLEGIAKGEVVVR